MKPFEQFLAAQERFLADQVELSKRVDSGARLILLDPDGMWSDWLAIVIEAPTNVIYWNQCGGTTCQELLAEGYLVPIGGSRFNPDNGPIYSEMLTSAFHNGRRCTYGALAGGLPEERLARLSEAVQDIPYWSSRSVNGQCSRQPLQVDTNRTFQMCEAWVPVMTPDGAGTLMWGNCD